MLLALTVAADPLLLSGRCPELEDLLLGAILPMVNKYVSVYSSRVRVACVMEYAEEPVPHSLGPANIIIS